MVQPITNLLGQMEMMGVFSYIIPFLLIFAIIYAVLTKTRILGPNNAIAAIISVAVGILSLQFNFVSTFFADIFPKFGVVMAIFLVLVILLGFFNKGEEKDPLKNMRWIGWVLGIFLIIWSLSSWNFWGFQTTPFFWQIQQYLGWIIVGAIVVFVIVLVVKNQNSAVESGKKPE